MGEFSRENYPVPSCGWCGVGRRYIRLSWPTTGNASVVAKLARRSIRSRKLVQMAKAPPLHDVTGVAVIGDHKLRLLFDDGTVGDVSFEDDPWDGVFAPLKDPEEFARVTIEHGSLAWPDHELDWAPEPLYEAALAHSLVTAS